MKFNRTINEINTNTSNQPAQIDFDDLNNPALKNILSRIEQTKKRHAQELINLEKQLESIKAQNNKKQSGAGVPGL